MFFRIVPKLLSMTEGEHLASIEHLTVFGGRDNLGDVVGVSIYRDASLEDVERHPLAFQPAVIGAQQGSQLSAGRMPSHDDVFGVTTVLRDMAVHPGQGTRNVFHQGFHAHRGQKPILGRDQDTALFGQHPGLVAHIALVTHHPTTAMDPEKHRSSGVGFALGRVDVEHMSLFPAVGVGDVGMKGLSVRARAQGDHSDRPHEKQG